jgi:transposase
LWAIDQVAGGRSVAAVAADVDRSTWWVSKWRRRYRSEGVEGLRDRSRAPKRRPTATPSEVVAKILEVRRRLERSEFSNVGAEAIQWDLEDQGWNPIPSLSTIERILSRAGITNRDRKTGPKLHRLSVDANTPGIWQQADWVGPRWIAGQQFSSLHLVDIGGGGAAAAQYPNQTQLCAVRFLTEIAWPRLGIPNTIQVDNQFVATSHRHNPWTLWTRACLYFGAELVVAPPRELGWNNHVESFNSLWQNRTIRRHNYPSLTDLTNSSDRFINYYMNRRRHPRLTTTNHGTRYPQQLLNQLHPQLRYPPPGFTITDYLDTKGNLHIPLARGRLTYLRRVQPGNVINIAGTWWPLPTGHQGRCVVATILTRSQRLTIRDNGHTLTSHHYPITQPTIEPYHPPAHHGLYYQPQE